MKDLSKILRKDRDYLLKRKQRNLDWALDKGSESYGSLYRDTLDTMLHSYHRIIKELEKDIDKDN